VVILANVTGTPTLGQNQTLNFETGATGTSGGDVLWGGGNLTPQGNARVFNLGPLGTAGFGAVTEATLQALPFSSSPLSSATLVTNDVFAVKTNNSHYAAVLVTNNAGAQITLQFNTFGVNATGGAPNITKVLNNYSYTPPGFSNSGIAQGSLFVVVGSGLADPTAVAVLQNATNGLPTTLNGASVKVTVGSTTVTPVIYYAYAGAIALVMPSSTPTGSGTVTATYNNQASNAFNIQVTSNAMGFDSYYGTGSGLGVATNVTTGALYSYASSIPPGTNVTLWGSGLGADPDRDTKLVGAAFAINSLAHVYVGGKDATILYQGASGYPGLNQVNITIPNDAATGCNVSVVGVNSSGVPTNFITLPIGSGACSDPAFGSAGNALQNLAGQGTVKTGFVAIARQTAPGAGGQTSTFDGAVANFSSTSGSSYGAASGSVSVGGCIVSQNSSGGSSATSTGLDAGTVTVSNSAGASTTLQTTAQLPGSYFAQLAAGFIGATGGTFTFKGGGGSSVGTFTASIDFPNPLLAWTNQASLATVTRGNGMPVTWTGGASGSLVFISGSSSASGAAGSFTCIAPVTAGQFTVPNWVLNAMPAGSGTASVQNQTTFQTFTASGLDIGLAAGYTSTSIQVTYN
jgi:uncharacterized protein (TIGR03437 family)